MSIDLRPSALRRKLLDLPTERAIALGRFALALVCVAAVIVAPPVRTGARQELWICMIGYVVFAGVLAFASHRQRPRSFLFLEQGIDIAVTGVMIFFTEGSSSALFSLFMFNLVVGLLRWNWRGALTVAGITASSLLLLPAQFTVTDDGLTLVDADLSRAVVLGGVLMICGAMLAYLGAHRERSRRRFEQLAAWPTDRRPADLFELPERSLAHVAMMMQSPRILVLWEEDEEPVRRVCLWDGGQVERVEVGPTVFGVLNEPGAPNVSFSTDRESARSLDPDLRERYGIRNALAAGFSRPRCSGRIFVLDRWIWGEEDAAVAELIAERVGIDLEDGIARRQVEAALVNQERMRVGRDLHDGLLQDLAAVNIQLKLLSDRVTSPEDKTQLATVRRILMSETDRVREFVEESRSSHFLSGQIAVIGQLRRQAGLLVAKWSCAVEVHVEPAELALPFFTVRHLEHILSEATSNAVRHGGASRVSLALTTGEDDDVFVHIRDNGSGFRTSDGVVAAGEAITAPLSLRSRIEELGGDLDVANATSGIQLTIRLPA